MIEASIKNVEDTELTGFEKALLGVLVLVLMAGMGATLELRRFVDLMRKPKGIVVGLASQFVCMPIIALALSKAFALPEDMALGLIIVGCTPGGTTSNLFAYYARADVALSIAMTVVSTAVAVFVMPVLLQLYTAHLSDAALAMPLGRLMQTLTVVIVPVLIGLWVRAQRPQAARILEKIGSYAGMATLLLLVASSLYRHGSLFLQTTPFMYVAAGGLGLMGMLFGLAGSRLFGLSRAQSRAVALETGIQNSPLAFAVIVTSFSDDLHLRLLWLPMLYALLVLLTGTAFAMAASRRSRAVAQR